MKERCGLTDKIDSDAALLAAFGAGVHAGGEGVAAGFAFAAAAAGFWKITRNDDEIYPCAQNVHGDGREHADLEQRVPRRL